MDAQDESTVANKHVAKSQNDEGNDFDEGA